MTDAKDDVRIRSLSPPALQRQMSGQPTPRNNVRRDSPPSNRSDSMSKRLAELNVQETDSVTTYVISVPAGKKIPKKLLKYSSMKKIDANKTLEEFISDVATIQESANEIVNNINQISINCASCCVSMRTCLQARDVDIEAKANVNVNASQHTENVEKKNVLDSLGK